jgi:hypothetical protein
MVGEELAKGAEDDLEIINGVIGTQEKIEMVHNGKRI